MLQLHPRHVSLLAVFRLWLVEASFETTGGSDPAVDIREEAGLVSSVLPSDAAIPGCNTDKQ
jgi:hypothetical protein